MLPEKEKFQAAGGRLMGLIEENSKDWQTHFILATLYAEIE